MRRSTVLIFALLIGCSAPHEVAVVTQRAPRVEAVQPASGPAIETPLLPPVVAQAGRFDGGKMWTFDNPPLAYFQDRYGLDVDSLWLAQAMQGALRFGNQCSASFVSGNGLVLTNHHCARASITKVNEEGEDLLQDGFLAATQEEERKVTDLHVEQLIRIEDVTSSVLAAGRRVRGDDEQARVRASRIAEIERNRTRLVAAEDSSLRVQVVELFSGGRYAAYTLRRYDDVRLVMAPEKALGYFGGETDNFTYPRYALDLAFFRVYDSSGKPYVTEDHYQWSTDGTSEGDVVFVVGNPGATSRLGTVASLEHARDHSLPLQVAWLEKRVDALDPFREDDAAGNAYFSLSNSLKSLRGQLEGLADGRLVARRGGDERRLKEAVAASDSLTDLYGNLFTDIEELQYSKRAEISRSQAFAFFGTSLGSRVLTRALYAYVYAMLKRRGYTSEQEFAEIRTEAMEFESLPHEAEVALVALRLKDIRDALGENDPSVRRITSGQPIDSVAARLIAATALMDTTGLDSLLRGSYLSSDDASVPIIEVLAPLVLTAQGQAQSFGNREELLTAKIAQLKFALDSTGVAPDASFSLRLADGIVKGYNYNGTRAPAYTTFYGLYDHYYAYHSVSLEWDLPDRWLSPPDAMDLSVPLNLVSTNDITGGNSGSPLLNRDLEIVGLVFDGNIESLPNVFLYTDQTARAVSVDSRGILEALEHIYEAHRLVAELTAPSP